MRYFASSTRTRLGKKGRSCRSTWKSRVRPIAGQFRQAPPMEIFTTPSCTLTSRIVPPWEAAKRPAAPPRSSSTAARSSASVLPPMLGTSREPVGHPHLPVLVPALASLAPALSAVMGVEMAAKRSWRSRVANGALFSAPFTSAAALLSVTGLRLCQEPPSGSTVVMSPGAREIWASSPRSR